MRHCFFHSLKVRYPDQRVGAVTFGAPSLLAAQRWLDTRNLVPVEPAWKLSAVITDREPPKRRYRRNGSNDENQRGGQRRDCRG